MFLTLFTQEQKDELKKFFMKRLSQDFGVPQTKFGLNQAEINELLAFYSKQT